MIIPRNNFVYNSPSQFHRAYWFAEFIGISIYNVEECMTITTFTFAHEKLDPTGKNSVHVSFIFSTTFLLPFQFCPIRILWCVWLKTRVCYHRIDHPRFSLLCLKKSLLFHFSSMFPVGGFASSGTGATSSASHRGIDLGPTRLHMPIGLLRRIRGSADPEIATGSPVRYGSGARLHSRERDRRGRRVYSFDATNTRADPPEPATKQDWLDALNSFTSRIETLEKNQRKAVLIGRTDERLVENHTRVNDLSETVNTVGVKGDQNRANLEEACKNITTRFATTEATELAIAQVIGQLENLNTEFQMLLRTMNLEQPRPQSSSVEPMPVAINTPETRPQSGFPQEPAQGQSGGFYPSGPGGAPMWNSSLPPAAAPSAPMPAGPITARSPLRSQDQPYVAPPQPNEAPAPTADHAGVANHGACFQATPPVGPPGCSQAF